MNHTLALAAIRAAHLLLYDMGSYGFGRCWQENGQACYEIYLAVKSEFPDAYFGNIYELERWARTNGVEL